MILQEVLDILQTAANAGFAQTEVLCVDNTQHKELKGFELINKTNANKFVFSTGETLIESKNTLSLNFETKKEEK